MGLELLHTYGSTKQQERFLAPLRTGDARVSFGLSEPGGGTDIARVMSTTAVRLSDGSYSISGSKKWIGGAADCDFFILLARTSPIKNSAVDGITTFLIPRSSPGIHTEEIDTMGIRGLAQRDVTLENVLVPPEFILGDEGRSKPSSTTSWTQPSRSISPTPPAAGRRCLRHCRNSRRHPVGHGKLAASAAATDAIDTGMRVMAGWGMARALPMQRFFRDARLYIFAPLTDEMTRNYLGEKLLGLPRSY